MILKLLSGESHPHMISLLATFVQHDRQHLIFPCAEMNLRNFWMKFKPRTDETGIMWFAEQSAGIASALARIHGPHDTGPRSSLKHLSSYQKQINPAGRPRDPSPLRYGQHCDIKAENLLLFRPSGQAEFDDCLDDFIIKISDFGLAGFDTSASPTQNGDEHRVEGTGAYAAPEVFEGHAKVGQTRDIWALGCVYLEFITWLLGGWDLLSTFEANRKKQPGDCLKFFHNPPGGSPKVKYCIIQVRELKSLTR